MIERTIDIETRDGRCTTFVVHPERGGPAPVLLFYMDAPGIREELRDMARRLAACGYYVMLPNLYYRDGVMEIWPIPMDPEAPERKRMFALMSNVTIENVMRDTETLIAFADADAAARPGSIGTLGYCMSGQHAINAAARFPARVTAAASLYGVMLITDKPTSPHRVANKAKAELYFACAERDSWAPLDTVRQLDASLKEDGVLA
ncbi:MAG TPA: hydrolase, partial [Alphaproteobacteria bacterium]|nr:hydrolase [Alphaproteobacteria bacterium]